MALSNINKQLADDHSLEKSQKLLNNHIGYKIDPSDGRISFDFCYLKKNRIQGQFVKSLQGDHTTAYSVIVTSLERRLSGKTITELLSHIALDVTNPSRPTLHNDLFILFYFYAKIAGHGSHFYLREKLQNVHSSYKKLHSILYDESKPSVAGTNPQKFLQSVIDYIYHYLISLQFFPFSAVYAEPGHGSGGRGESSALRFLKNLEHRSTISQNETVGFFSKLFDEQAIQTLIKKFSQGNTEIIAFQLMGFLSALEGFPAAKEMFFENGHVAVSKAKLNYIGYVIFGYWKKGTNQIGPKLSCDRESDLQIIKNALLLIAQMRSKVMHFAFLT